MLPGQAGPGGAQKAWWHWVQGVPQSLRPCGCSLAGAKVRVRQHEARLPLPRMIQAQPPLLSSAALGCPDRGVSSSASIEQRSEKAWKVASYQLTAPHTFQPLQLSGLPDKRTDGGPSSQRLHSRPGQVMLPGHPEGPLWSCAGPAAGADTGPGETLGGLAPLEGEGS